MNSVFNKAGKKIMILAKVLFVCGNILSIIGCIVFFTFAVIYSKTYMILLGLAVFIGGIVVSWLSSIFIYAFGSLVENSEIIAENL